MFIYKTCLLYLDYYAWIFVMPCARPALDRCFS